MVFAQGLIEDLAAFDAYEKWRQRAETAPAAALTAQHLSRLKNSALRIAAHTVALGSLANRALTRPVHAATASVLEELPIRFSVADGVLIDELRQDAPYAELAADWTEAEVRNRCAITLSRLWAREAGRDPRAEPIVPIDAVADAWQRAAVALDVLLRSFADLIPSSTNADRMMGLLQAVARGEAPASDAQGTVEVPGWAERRRDARKPANFDVMLAVRDGKVHPAFAGRVVNVSRSGVGLQTRQALDVGSTIEVHRDGASILTGTVRWTTPAWAKPTLAGLELDQPLPDDDPWTKGVTPLAT